MTHDGVRKILELRKYYTPMEVAQHNVPENIWVSYLGKVYDLTNLCAKHTGDPLLKPILRAAGTDISHWFNPVTGEPRTYVDPVTLLKVTYTPWGRYLDVPPPETQLDWRHSEELPWWRDEGLAIGNLSKKTQNLTIVNMLTRQTHVVEVCREEKLYDILLRYKNYNAHAESYTWKYDRRVLNMAWTLAENGITDDDDDFYQLMMDDHVYLQTIHLYFNDDLTEG